MKKNIFIGALLVLTVVLSACGSSQAAATAIPAATITPVVPTNTPMPTPTQVVKSGSGTDPVTLMIENKSNASIQVFWLDFDGVEQLNDQVSPDSTFTSETFSTHAWRLRDEAGKELATIIDTAQRYQLYVIASDRSISQQVYNPCKLPSVTADRGVALGFPPIAERMPSAGTVKAAVLFVDFPDMPGSKTPEQLFAMLSPGAPDFYKAVSYGRLDWQLVPDLVILHLTKTTVQLGLADNEISFEDQRGYIQEAVETAKPNFDFTGMQAVYVISDPANSPTSIGPAFTGFPGGGINTGGTEILNGVTSGQDLPYWGFLWINHEVGHTMGLVDLYPYEVDSTKNTSTYDDSSRFVGDFSLMGNINGKGKEPLAFERWQLGWLDDSQVVCQLTNDQTTTLSAIETPGGTKAVMVPTGKTTAVVVESRHPFGYDQGLPKTGALVYTIDTSIYSGMGVIQIQPIIAGDPLFLKSPLAVGESVTVGNVTITVTASDANGDTVQVKVATP
jgi:M6 family metalloprotease-like protein